MRKLKPVAYRSPSQGRLFRADGKAQPVTFDMGDEVIATHNGERGWHVLEVDMRPDSEWAGGICLDFATIKKLAALVARYEKESI